MTIEWLTVDDLEARLTRGFPPVGLRLRTLFHAGIESDAALAAELGRAPEVIEVPEFGMASAWGGVTGGVPFSILLAGVGDRWGLRVDLPVQTRDGKLDLALLETIGQLPLPFAACRAAMLEPLPFAGAGWAVVADGVERFRAPIEADAATVAAWLGRVPGGPYTVAAAGAADPIWLVVGPETGPFVSRLEGFATAAAAERCAAQWRTETGAAFAVYANTVR